MKKTRIIGASALAFARVLNAAGLDTPGQWGRAYFRCHQCGDARDCTGLEDWDDDCLGICNCYGELTVGDLRISEGWIDSEFVAAMEKLNRRLET